MRRMLSRGQEVPKPTKPAGLNETGQNRRLKQKFDPLARIKTLHFRRCSGLLFPATAGQLSAQIPELHSIYGLLKAADRSRSF